MTALFPQVSFLGAGNMAAAMIEGLLRKDPTWATNLRCLGGSGNSGRELAARTKISLANSFSQLIEGADVLVLAFKPKHLVGVDQASGQQTQGRLLISVLAGKTLAQLTAAFPLARNIVRVMPNTPSRVGAGMAGWTALKPLTSADRTFVCSLLSAMGQEIELPEEQMDALTAVSGSGPAYVFEFASALRDAGIAAGLTAEVAARLSIATVAGAAKLLEAGTATPEELRQQVTSPNGVTYAGLQALEQGKFRELIATTVRRAKARAGELARET